MTIVKISHPTHPHDLLLEYSEIPFNCDGCKETGIGLKYKCKQCKFDLHEACGMTRPIITHPFYKKCEFGFYRQTPGTVTRICDACRNDVLGFVYHCKGCGFDLHPCCANLPPVLKDGEHNLNLCLKLSSACHHCGGKGLGWSYRCECKNYNLHVSCVKELLVDKNKVREIQTRSPRGTLQNHHRRKGGKVRKCCQIAVTAVWVIVSAILGDPTAMIATVVEVFMSKKLWKT